MEAALSTARAAIDNLGGLVTIELQREREEWRRKLAQTEEYASRLAETLASTTATVEDLDARIQSMALQRDTERIWAAEVKGILENELKYIVGQLEDKTSLRKQLDDASAKSLELVQQLQAANEQLKSSQQQLAGLKRQLAEWKHADGERLMFKIPGPAFRTILQLLDTKSRFQLYLTNRAVGARVDAQASLYLHQHRRSESFSSNGVDHTPTGSVKSQNGFPVTAVRQPGSVSINPAIATGATAHPPLLASQSVQHDGHSNSSRRMSFGTAANALFPFGRSRQGGTPVKGTLSKLPDAGPPGLLASASFMTPPKAGPAVGGPPSGALNGMSPDLRDIVQALGNPKGIGLDYKQATRLLQRIRQSDATIAACKLHIADLSEKFKTVETVRDFLSQRLQTVEEEARNANAAKENALSQGALDHNVLRYLDERVEELEDRVAVLTAEREAAAGRAKALEDKLVEARSTTASLSTAEQVKPSADEGLIRTATEPLYAKIADLEASLTEALIFRKGLEESHATEVADHIATISTLQSTLKQMEVEKTQNEATWKNQRKTLVAEIRKLRQSIPDHASTGKMDNSEETK